MKPIAWFATIASLLALCIGTAAAQSCPTGPGGGYDLLLTSGGTQDNLSSVGLGTVTFQGLPLPGVAQAGTADTIVERLDAVPNPIPQNGACIPIQIIALSLQSTGTVICNNASCGSYKGQAVSVYATINQTGGTIPTSQLPQPDSLTASSGTMTVFPNGTFNTNGTTVQADLIVVPPGSAITARPIFSTPMPSDTITANGSSWTTTAPPGYPNSPVFPSGGFYVNSFTTPLVAKLTSQIVRVSLYGFGLLLICLAIVKIRTGVKLGSVSLRPVYMLGLALMAWFIAWKSGGFVFPMVAQAKAVGTCLTQTASVWVNEGGYYVVHVIRTANCSPLQTQTASLSVNAQ
jgi:hypothetical protein